MIPHGTAGAPARYCGRVFTPEELDHIRRLIVAEPRPNRAALSRLVCRALGWLKSDGRLKDMACRVAMLRMHRDGIIVLPDPEKGNANGRIRPKSTTASDPRPGLSLPAGALGELDLLQVGPENSAFWNELVERHHYLGYKPLPGAQLRYLVFGGGHLLAALGFGAAAWAVAPRDRFIGWTREQRQRNLHRVVNNARFLILPWIDSHNLASRILGAIVKRLGRDWEQRHGYHPVLLETFVDRTRFKGTCYRAANWIHVGHTQGRGKLDRYRQEALPVKDIFLYPLHKHFRRELLAA